MKELDPKVLDQMSAQKAVEKKAEVLNIDALIKLGMVEKHGLEILPGFIVDMHVITQQEREALGKYIEDKEMVTMYARGEALKRPTLAWAITKLNDEVFETEEQKITLLNQLRAVAGTAIDIMYLAYQNLYMEQFELLQTGIKKKL